MPVAVETDRELAQELFRLMPLLARLAQTVARERDTPPLERARILWPLLVGPVRAGELAQRCHLGRPALTEVVEALVEEGLVRRDEDPDDRRAVVLAITPQGRRELHRFESGIAAALSEIIGRLQPAKRERLRAALSDLHRAFRAHSASLGGTDVR